jgi:F420-0:gamma-glutamyl ligase
MNIKPIKTRILNPPQDDLLAVIKESVKEISENSVLAVTSKVAAIWQGRCVDKNSVSKDDLIKREAEYFLPRENVPQSRTIHTLKNNLLGRSAGIDESNADGFYVLWPEDPMAAAKQIWDWVRQEYKVNNVGVILTDSHAQPLRRGAIGHTLGYFGFRPLNDYRGSRDLFNRKFVLEQANVADGLGAAAVLAMGEGEECTPLALITDIPFVQFIDQEFQSDQPFSSLEVPMEEDVFYPFLKNVPWERGGQAPEDEDKTVD